MSTIQRNHHLIRQQLNRKKIEEGENMIITKTPFKMSFFGGGTDRKEFFLENGGAVLSTTFDKYCYVNARQQSHFFEYAMEFDDSKTKDGTAVEEIRYPVIRKATEMLDLHGIRLTYESDLPVGAGLGTGSSFSVGMLNAFHALKGNYAGKKELADEAIYLERILCREAGGWQDQIAVSFGGLNRINFDTSGYEVIPITITPERKKQLNQNLLMFCTGLGRFPHDVQKENNFNKKERTIQLREMYSLVNEAERILTDATTDLDDFGRLMDHTWKLNREIGSAGRIDCLYKTAINAGAMGGELFSANDGSFLVFYVQPEKQDMVHQVMKELMYIPFEFEDGGSTVVYDSAERFEA